MGGRPDLRAHLPGFAYLAFILDVYSRRIVGWQIATHMRTELVVDALEMATRCASRPPAG